MPNPTNKELIAELRRLAANDLFSSKPQPDPRGSYAEPLERAADRLEAVEELAKLWSVVDLVDGWSGITFNARAAVAQLRKALAGGEESE